MERQSCVVFIGFIFIVIFVTCIVFIIFVVVTILVDIVVAVVGGTDSPPRRTRRGGTNRTYRVQLGAF